MIQLNHLQKIYRTHEAVVYAINDVTLTVKKGEIFGVLGKSGAGKSTLLRMVNLLERPSAGEVFVDGTLLTALSREALRKARHKIGMIFQHFNLLSSRSVADNIALPLEIQGESFATKQRVVTELLALIGLSDKQHCFPHQLSGGQKQRVGIARALAARPTVLLCDEATSALDTESTKAILMLLKKINREFGLTILLITHELEVVKHICDRVGILHHGQLIEEETTVNLFANPIHAIAKQLVQQALHFYSPKPADAGSLILKLIFLGKESELPLISSIAKQFNVSVNIKQALIENIQETTVGFTICQLMGEKTAIQQALAYIQSTSIRVEILHAID